MASHVVLLGPPGAGKGTHAQVLSERYGLPHISAGDLLRFHIRDGTPLGRRAKAYVDEGHLVPDGLVIEMMEARLRDADVKGGFLLDGFPRTAEQARALDRMLARQRKRIDLAIDFETSEATLVERLSGRQTCPSCGANYHVRNIPPKQAGICDRCQSKLVQRTDDQPETIRERLRVYQTQTEPLIQFYRASGALCQVDGNLGIESLQNVLAPHFGSE